MRGGVTRDYVTQNADETFAVGQEVGRRFKGGEVLLLFGPLGAGKTQFVRGLADGLGLGERPVTGEPGLDLGAVTQVVAFGGALPLLAAPAFAADEVKQVCALLRGTLPVAWPERWREAATHPTTQLGWVSAAAA